MKTIDLNKYMVDLDGNEIQNKENKLSMALAGVMLNQKNGDAIKLFDWAVELNKEGKIDVDDSDFEKIKELIKTNEGFLSIAAKAQLLKAMNNTDK